MNRNESWQPAEVETLVVHMAWASLEMLTDDVETIQLLVAGDEMDVTDLKASLEGTALTIEQPAYGLTHKLNTVRWMQVTLRLPRTWKGTVEASTIAGPLKARGLNATDMSLETVSGDLRVMNLHAITLSLRTVTGSLNAELLQAEKAGLRTVSGQIDADSCSLRALKVSTVSGDASVTLTGRTDKVEGSSVAGDLRLAVNFDSAVVSYRTATGKLRTSGVSITDEGPEFSVSTVSGSLFLSRLEQPGTPAQEAG